MAQDTREFDRYRLARALGEIACGLDEAARTLTLSDEERQHLGATRCALIRVGDLIRAGVVPRDWLLEVLACAVRHSHGTVAPDTFAEIEMLLDSLAPPSRVHYVS